MGLAYLAVLVVALGVLGLQVVLGGHAGHGGGGAGHGHNESADQGAGWTVLLSVRFWLFAALGFGLSGTLLHFLSHVDPFTASLIAAGAGVASGLFASLALRLVRRGSATTEVLASSAVGRVGRVVVACGAGATGKVRIEIGGTSVDLMARADDAVAHGEAVIVEDIEEGVARVSRRPDELA